MRYRRQTRERLCFALGVAAQSTRSRKCAVGARARQWVCGQAIKARVERHAADALPIVQDVKASDRSGLRQVAHELNVRGILTARDGLWHPTTVRNLLMRAGCYAGP